MKDYQLGSSLKSISIKFQPLPGSIFFWISDTQTVILYFNLLYPKYENSKAIQNKFYLKSVSKII